MVTADQIRAAAYDVVASSTDDARVATAARERARATGAPSLPGVTVPAGQTTSRALHEVRVMVESSDFDLARVESAVRALSAEHGCESEARVLLAAARVREGRRLRRSGDMGAAAQLAMLALDDVSAALGADATNREGLALLDEIEAMTGYARLTDEVRRAMG